MKKILYAAAECTPFIKTGGLGDVVGSLPKRLNRNKYDVRVVIPDYMCLDHQWKSQMKTEFSFPVTLGWRSQMMEVKSMNHEGLTIYFIHNDYYFAGDSPYSDMRLDIEKFCFFSKAVLEMLSYMDYAPDIIHCHDWQSSMIPVYLKLRYAQDPFYAKMKSIMTIHNLKFQGRTYMEHLKDASGLSDDAFTYDKLEHYDSANMLKGGLTFADKITTVSESYAKEIQDPAYGESLDGLLRFRSDDLTGIVNGIDTDVYNPYKDEYIPVKYNSNTWMKGKKGNKKALFESIGWDEDEDAFTIGAVARLTGQKGYELLDPIIDELMRENIRIIILGSGETEIQNMLLWYQGKYPDRIHVDLSYSDAKAKLMYAGLDSNMMPSSFEPCGLSQLMSMRYGTVPIVRAIGGLKDTVIPYNKEDGSGTGFVFEDFDSNGLRWAIMEAYHVYHENPKAWKQIAVNGMRQNYSWKISCKHYEKLYDEMIND